MFLRTRRTIGAANGWRMALFKIQCLLWLIVNPSPGTATLTSTSRNRGAPGVSRSCCVVSISTSTVSPCPTAPTCPTSTSSTPLSEYCMGPLYLKTRARRSASRRRGRASGSTFPAQHRRPCRLRPRSSSGRRYGPARTTRWWMRT
ncbi:hypothetical protein B0H17DRAFT_336283 [Mycena rosella]|uniref:Secreted protein n=1 Tax=Mycena rosella TaxID=1033263 RepID=A0AAD7CS48_MYCRO|nr:hypothetical protein B0H17DRAFT_336283 [Mycena rosella]